jgi:hypothetical protein
MKMSQGRIWPEYWIDCCKCDHHQPLAVQKAPAAEARKQGWRRDPTRPIDGPWICPTCQTVDI